MVPAWTVGCISCTRRLMIFAVLKGSFWCMIQATDCESTNQLTPRSALLNQEKHLQSLVNLLSSLQTCLGRGGQSFVMDTHTQIPTQPTSLTVLLRSTYMLDPRQSNRLWFITYTRKPTQSHTHVVFMLAGDRYITSEDMYFVVQAHSSLSSAHSLFHTHTSTLSLRSLPCAQEQGRVISATKKYLVEVTIIRFHCSSSLSCVFNAQVLGHMTSALKTYLVKDGFIVSSERHKEGAPAPGQRGRSVLIMRALTVSEFGGREDVCRSGSSSEFTLEVCLEAAQGMTSSRSLDGVSKRIQDVYREEMMGGG